MSLTINPAALGVLLSSALVLSAQAKAQSAAPSGPSDQAAQEASPDIVVTAQKRSERNVDVPISITALDRQALVSLGVTGSLDLGKVTPGLRMDTSNVFVQPTIRGISSSTSGPGLPANVGIYVDGFYVPSMIGGSFDLSSVSDIEILKGPQGTLFGRNATGGVISIHTLDPSFDTSGYIVGHYGNHEDAKLEAYITTPINSVIAINANLYIRKSDGYTHNVLTDENEDAFSQVRFRGKILFQPSSQAKFILTYEHTDSKDPRGPIYYPLDGNTAANLMPGAIISKPRDSAQNLQAKNNAKIDGVYLKGSYDLGGAGVTSYTGYRTDRYKETSDLDGSSATLFQADWRETEKTFTQEVNLANSAGGPLKWVLGGFYLHNVGADPYFNLAFCDAPGCRASYISSKVVTDSIAGFADGTYEIAARLFLTGGLRYSRDHLRYSFEAGSVPPTVTASHTWSDLTPRAIIRFEPNTSSSIYASVTRGFKSGAFNSGSTSTIPVAPEKITAYEVGYKLSTRPFKLSAAAYYYDYKDLQYTSYSFTAAEPVQELLNAGAAHIYGAELQADLKAARNLDISANLAYTHGRYTDFQGAVGTTPIFSGGEAVGNVVAPFDASGNTLVRAPEWTANVSMLYKHPLGPNHVELSGNLFWSGKAFFDPKNSLAQSSYALLDLRASYVFNGDRWRLSAYATNVTNKLYLVQVFSSAVANLGRYGEPRSYGAEVEVKF